jgi:hypothetical protein
MTPVARVTALARQQITNRVTAKVTAPVRGKLRPSGGFDVAGRPATLYKKRSMGKRFVSDGCVLIRFLLLALEALR